MIYTIKHITDYVYEDYVSYCHNLATLKPRDCPGQQLLDYSLAISPTPSDITERIDFFGNNITRFSIQGFHDKLQVTTHSKVLRDVGKYRETYYSEACKRITLTSALATLKQITPEMLNANQFVLESSFIRKLVPEIKDYALISFQPNRPVFEAGYELMERIFHDFKFVPGFTNVSTPINEVIHEKKGVCQDFAQIAIACIRSVGLPARYVSGYIETIPPKGKEKLVGADASHAWAAIYIPGIGWVDLDPTNNLIPGDQHIVVAWGRDYYDVPPLKGVIYSNGKNEMTVSVDIRPAEENPENKT